MSTGTLKYLLIGASKEIEIDAWNINTTELYANTALEGTLSGKPLITNTDNGKFLIVVEMNAEGKILSVGQSAAINLPTIKPVVIMRADNDYRNLAMNTIGQTYTIIATGGTINPSNIRIVYSSNDLGNKAKNIYIDHAMKSGISYSSITSKLQVGTYTDGYWIEITDVAELQIVEEISIMLRYACTDWSHLGPVLNETIEVYYDGILVQRDQLP